MQIKNLDVAIAEAKRFLEKAEELKKRSVDEDWSIYGSPIQQGATRRASMDLTRALAQLRKS